MFNLQIYLRKSFCLAAFVMALLGSFIPHAATATVLTFDDVQLATEGKFPSDFQGPIGFSESGYQFSNNIVIFNISGTANGPAYSGNNVALNTYVGYYGFGPDFTITRTGGGLFSFNDVYLQSYTHSSHSDLIPGSGEIQGNIFGFLNNNLVAIASYSNILTWTDVSSVGALGSFANIDTLVIDPTTNSNNSDRLTLLDNLNVTSVAVSAPGPIAGAGLLPTLGFCLAAFWWSRRRKQASL